MERKYTVSDNLTMISILLLFILNYIEHGELTGILFTWLIYLLVMGNVKRLNKKYMGLRILRYCCYIIPLFAPIFLGFHLHLKCSLSGILCGMVIGGGIITYRFFLSKSKVYQSKQILSTYKKDEAIEYIAQIIVLIGGTIAEEVFYRDFILSVSSLVAPWILFLLSVILFIANHACLKWNQSYKRKDYIVQLCIGCMNAALFLVFDSVIPCIIVHLSWNVFAMLIYAKLFYLFYMNVQSCNEDIMEDDFFD